jgi:hypothetical protein
VQYYTKGEYKPVSSSQAYEPEETESEIVQLPAEPPLEQPAPEPTETVVENAYVPPEQEKAREIGYASWDPSRQVFYKIISYATNNVQSAPSQ